MGANANESTLESLIANLANYPDRDPAKLIEAAAQISESSIPLEKLEEHVKALMTEKETLQREIDEGGNEKAQCPGHPSSTGKNATSLTCGCCSEENGYIR